MSICSFAPRSLVPAGAFIGIFSFGAAAQQPAIRPPRQHSLPRRRFRRVRL